jgi:DNA-binding transcriptional LysR family regulator
VVGRFRRTHPDVRLALQELDTPTASAALLAGELDVAVGRGSPRGAGAEDLVTVPIGADHLVAVVSLVHPFAGQLSVEVGQLAQEPLVVSADAAGSYLRRVFEHDPAALDSAALARDIHTIAGLAACCAGVGLGPNRMRMIACNDIRFCDVEPRFRLPDLQMSFRVTDSSPVLAAFLSVVRQNCAEVDNRLDDLLARHPAATERQPALGVS